MPFIKHQDIEPLTGPIDQLVEHLSSLPPERRAPVLSYVIFSLLIKVFGDDIPGLIQGIGTIEETKLTYYAELMEPVERRILTRRWLEPDWPVAASSGVQPQVAPAPSPDAVPGLPSQAVTKGRRRRQVA